MDLYRMQTYERRRGRKHWFIRQLSVTNFRVLCYADSQLKALEDLLRLQRGSVVAHLDSTGWLIRALPKEIEGTGEIYNYVISIDSPRNNCAPLPVVEFILNEHDTETILRCLKYFDAE